MLISSRIASLLCTFMFSIVFIACQDEKIDADAYDVSLRRGQKSPQINEITPSTGEAGTEVVIIGKYFSPRAADNTVLFNGVATEVLSASPSELIVNAPSGAGTGHVQVIVRGRQSSGNPVFTYESAISVITIAGSTRGNEDGPALQAKFGWISGMVFDEQGNLYITDPGNHSIRKMTPDGIVSTIAGGVPGFADGTGSEAMFNHPSDITIDHDGNLIVCEFNNCSIRKVTPEGVVTTISGTGEWGYVDGPAQTAMFDSPEAVAVDKDGNIIVADYFNHRIRKITPAGMVSTIAGTGPLGYEGGGHNDGAALQAVFTMPVDLVIDDNGDIYITEQAPVIRKLSNGVVSTIAGHPTEHGFLDGPAFEARFHNPWGIDLDSAKNIFVVDSYNGRIRKIATDGTVSTFAGNGTAADNDGPLESATFHYPRELRFGPDWALYVSGQNPTLRKIQ
jgi:hypothetical protein